MFNLIRNEFQKLVKKPKFLITIIILCAMTGGACFISYMQARDQKPEKQIEQNKRIIEDYNNMKKEAKNDDEKKKFDETILELESRNKYLEAQKDDSSVDYKKALNDRIEMLKKQKEIQTDKTSQEPLVYIGAQDVDQEIKVLQYQIDNNIKPEKDYEVTAFKTFDMINSFLAVIIIAILVAVVSSDIVSGEYNPATIKLLITKPVSRSKILLSKFITVVLASVVSITGIKLLGFLIMGLIFKFGNPAYPVAVYTKYVANKEMVAQMGRGLMPVKDSLKIMTQGNIMLLSVLFYMLFITAVVAFCFLNSTIMKSAASSMSLNMIILIVLSTFSGLSSLPATNSFFKFIHKVMPFVFIIYNNANDVVTGVITNKYSNLMINAPFAIMILVVSIVVFYGISNYVFNKRDILA